MSTSTSDFSGDETSNLLRSAVPHRYNGVPNDSEALPEMTASNLVLTPSPGSNSRKVTQYIAALAAAGGALAAGTILGWSSPAQGRLINDNEYPFPVDNESFSWISSSMTLGAAAVCIPIGILVKMIGRKLTMLGLVAPFIVGWACVIWAQNIETMIAGRVFLGIAGGAFCVAAPLYTGEIAQKEIRGILGTFFQLMITIGILFAYAVGHGVDVFTLSIICGVIPLIFGVIFFFMPETPLYLVMVNKPDAAKKSIEWLRGKKYDAQPELAELQHHVDEINSFQGSALRAFSRPASIRAICIAVGLMFFQQLSGINAVIFYQTDIFEAAKIDLSAGEATIIVGVIQVVATFISSLVVDRLGRRILLLASASVMAICTILIGVFFYLQSQDPANVESLGWLPVFALSLFIIMFSFGFGPVPWLMVGELFASEIKGIAGALAGTSNWLLAFLVTKTFVNLRDAIGTGETFWLFSGLSILGTIFVFFLVPETKGKSLAEIQEMLGGSGSRSTDPEREPQQSEVEEGKSPKY